MNAPSDQDINVCPPSLLEQFHFLIFKILYITKASKMCIEFNISNKPHMNVMVIVLIFKRKFTRKIYEKNYLCPVIN